MRKAKHITISILLWLTISPLFLYSTRKWHQLNWPLRIILLLISPLFLCAYLCVLITVAIATADPNDWQDPEGYRAHMEEHYSNPEAFEKSTGVRLPPFKVTEYEHGYVCWNGDFEDELTIEFDKPLSDKFYHYLDSLVEVDDGWIKSIPYHGYTCSSHIVVLNDSIVYEGITSDDQYFVLHIKYGETMATIIYGAS